MGRAYSFTLRPLYSRWKSKRYSQDRIMGGPQSGSGRCEEEKNSLAWIELRLLVHPARRLVSISTELVRLRHSITEIKPERTKLLMKELITPTNSSGINGINFVSYTVFKVASASDQASCVNVLMWSELNWSGYDVTSKVKASAPLQRCCGSFLKAVTSKSR